MLGLCGLVFEGCEILRNPPGFSSSMCTCFRRLQVQGALVPPGTTTVKNIIHQVPYKEYIFKNISEILQ